MPPRVTVPDMRRSKWLDALADPTIPLKDIAAKASQATATTPDFYIPHGPKGSELFELLYTKNVPIDRAVWFVRIVGYNDMVRAASVLAVRYWLKRPRHLSANNRAITRCRTASTLPRKS
jgi:hypothetical protein